jgi:hypothetical protein
MEPVGIAQQLVPPELVCPSRAYRRAIGWNSGTSRVIPHHAEQPRGEKDRGYFAFLPCGGYHVFAIAR